MSHGGTWLFDKVAQTVGRTRGARVPSGLGAPGVRYRTGRTAGVGRSLLEMTPVVSPPTVGAPQQAGPTDRPRRRGSPRTWAVVVLLAGTIVALAVWRLADSGAAPLTRADVNRAVKRGLEQSQQDQRATPPDAVTAYRTISPSLVTVTTERSAAPVAEPRSPRAQAWSSTLGAPSSRPCTSWRVATDPGPVRRRHAGVGAHAEQQGGQRHRRPRRRSPPPSCRAGGHGWRTADR